MINSREMRRPRGGFGEISRNVIQCGDSLRCVDAECRVEFLSSCPHTMPMHNAHMLQMSAFFVHSLALSVICCCCCRELMQFFRSFLISLAVSPFRSRRIESFPSLIIKTKIFYFFLWQPLFQDRLLEMFIGTHKIYNKKWLVSIWDCYRI